MVLGYADVGAAGDAGASLLDAGPIGLEGFDHQLVTDANAEHLRLPGLSVLPEGDAWLLVELGGSSAAQAQTAARDLMESVGGGGGGPSARVVDDPGQVAAVWAVREAALGATARLPGGARTWTGWEDSAVPPLASAATSATSKPSMTATATTPRCTAISAAAASTTASTWT